MTLSVGKIGLNTQKISFGKGGGYGKGCSSSYTSRSSYVSDDKGCSSCNDDKGNTTSCVSSHVSAPKPAKITRQELLDRLEIYRDDPVMFKIIMDQLRKLG